MKEYDIRPPHLMQDKKGLIEQDQQFLLASAHEFEQAPCPACHANTSTPKGTKQGFSYVTCAHCGTAYMNPRPSQALLHKFYATSKNYAYWNKHIFPATAEIRRKEIFLPRARKIAELCNKFAGKSIDLMEIGAAHGIFCEEAAKTGCFNRIIAVEPHPEQAQHCRETGLEVIELPVEQVTDSACADVLVAFEVLEHLHSPTAFLKACVRMLRHNGLLMLTCPNVKGFDVTMLGLQSDVFSHEHLNYYHPDSLTLLLENNGLTVLELSTPGRLDADIVRNTALRGDFDLSLHPFLRTVLIDEWDTLGAPFQAFLRQQKLSSQMMAVARKK